MPKKVMVGMSGGVDSSVAALLLKQQGYDVVGVTFRLWSATDACPQESGCCSIDDVNDAKYVCHTLGIPHYVFNYKELFREKVVDRFVQEYLAGRTPNPCIECNRSIKFSDIVLRAEAMGFDYVATGHYATIRQNPETGRYCLYRGKYDSKDQSYVLYCLTQAQLARTLMPLGEYSKEEVRRIAEENGLIVAKKPDSQDICFVPDGDYAGFIERYTGKTIPKGNFIDQDGHILGQHKGITHYTIGQRKGLGISLGKPVFVTDIDPKNNTVTLCEQEDSLFRTTLYADRLNFISVESLTEPARVMAKIRYAHKPSAATVFPPENGVARVEFDIPQRAATKGQAVVFFQQDQVLGGGTICQV